jgi:signal peptidase I
MKRTFKHKSIKLRQSARLVAGGALIVLLLFVETHFRLGLVLGRSMLPTFHTGDLLLVNKRAFDHADPQRGDIVLAKYHRQYVVKRIVGLPGEEVEVKRGTLYINGAPLAEYYRSQPGYCDIAGGRLLNGKFATLGDNRALPPGVGIHPIVTKDQIVGKVVFSISPPWPRRTAVTD